jgi:hypothetical protein
MSFINSKIRLTLLVALLAVFAAFATAHGLRGGFTTAHATSTAFQLDGVNTTQPLVVDMGEVLGGQTGVKTIRVRNTGSSFMKLTGKTGCGCTRISPAKPHLAPGEEVDVDVSYESSTQFNHHGAVTQPFTIVDEAKPEARIVLSASLSVFVRPSLIFSISRVIWDMAGSGLDPGAKTITVTNTLESPISMKWRRPSGPGVTLDITPAEVTLAPQQTVELKLDHVKLGSAMLPYTSVLRFDSIVTVGGNTIPIQHNLPMSILNRQVLTAVPGSLLFSPADVAAGTEKTLALQRTVDKGLSISRVAADDPRIRITPAGSETYTVHVSPDLKQSSLTAKINIAFRYEGHEASLDVPVFAYRKQQ